KAGTGVVNQIKHVFEAILPAIVGVRHLGQPRASEVQKQSGFSTAILVPDLTNVGKIGAIHHQYIVKLVQIFRTELAGAQVADIDTTARRGGSCPLVRGFTDMPAAGAAGINMQSVEQAMFLGEVTENSLGTGRATDIAQADKQHTYAISHGNPLFPSVPADGPDPLRCPPPEPAVGPPHPHE